MVAITPRMAMVMITPRMAMGDDNSIIPRMAMVVLPTLGANTVITCHFGANTVI